MSSVPAGLWLLAQVSREDFGRGFRGATSQLKWTDLIPYVAAAAAASLIMAVYRYWQRRNDMTLACDDPQKLFRELCQVHRLDHRSQKLLTRLAEVWQFPHPSQVFLTPAAFEPQRLPDALRAEADAIQGLRERLF